VRIQIAVVGYPEVRIWHSEGMKEVRVQPDETSFAAVSWFDPTESLARRAPPHTRNNENHSIRPAALFLRRRPSETTAGDLRRVCKQLTRAYCE
jgi:hypothetical protein